MISERRFSRRIGGCLLAMAVTWQAFAAADGDSAGTVPLLDFQDEAAVVALLPGPYTTVEPATSTDGKRAARIVFSAVPEGVRAYPAVIVESDGLRIRDFKRFEALSLRVMNPGTEEVDLSLAIWDATGRRSFPVPSTVTIAPARWQQVVVRLALHG